MAVTPSGRIAFCAALFFGLASAQPQGQSLISGTVVDGESGDPVRKAIVTLTLEGAPRRWATTRTDGSGAFRFDGLPAGKYDLRAAKSSEGTATYGVNKIGELGDSIELSGDEMRGGIKLRFLHAATISGHVYDADGDPLPNVPVNLLRPGRNLGAPILVNNRNDVTDDRGEYHFANIDPGRYYLRAVPNIGGRGGPATEVRQPILAPQYYGGARDSKDAVPIHASGGETLAGLDFHLNAEPPVEIRGRVLGVPQQIEPPSPTSRPSVGNGGGVVSFSFDASSLSGHIGNEPPGVQVNISPADSGSPGWSSGTTTQGDDHHFEMADMPAGRYRLDATLHSGTKTYGASEVLDLRPNAGEIVLTLAQAVDIQGTIRIEGTRPPAEVSVKRIADGSSLRVQLERPGGRQNMIGAEVGPDGHFTLPQVLPGEWQLSVTPVPPGFLKAAQFGDKDVRFTTFDVGAASYKPLNIVVSMHTATIDGEVDGGPAEAKRAGIVIAPIGQYHNLAGYYYGAPADKKGKFHFAAVAPGKYKVFAIEKMAAANFRTPEAADQLDELGEVIDVAEGAKVEAHPKLIPVERAEKALQ